MFLITWTEEAFEQMHRIALQYPHRNRRLSRALRQMDAHLRDDPLGGSESREDQNRICIVTPLTVYFTIDFEHDTVEITQVYFILKS